MTITKTVTLEADDDVINDILEELQNECESWANILLEKAGFELELTEYLNYRRKLSKEIFDDVVDKLIFDRKGAK